MDRYTLTPFYVEADTKDELVLKMLQINIETNAFHEFFDIQKDGQKWVSWYYKDMGGILKEKIEKRSVK